MKTVLFAGISLCLYVSAYSQTPFSCTAQFYQSRQLASGGADGGSSLSAQSFAGSGSTTTVIANSGAGKTFNAIGYNNIDNYIYGAANITSPTASNIIYRIGANGVVATVTITSGLPANKQYNAGDVDEDGFYYVKESGTNNIIYKINLTARTATSITLTSSIVISDFAIAKKDASGNIYAYTISDTDPSDPAVYQIKLSGSSGSAVGTVTNVGGSGLNFASGYAPGGPYFGGQLVDNENNFYVFENGTPNATPAGPARLYKIDVTTGVATYVKDLPPAERNDGAYCRTADVKYLLPVKWGAFKVTGNDTDALLTWETFSEANAADYTIEVSADGSHFISIGTIAANGNSSNRSVYTFTHYQAIRMGTSLQYRLKQTDNDGRYYYSVIVPFYFNASANNKLFVRPNPVNKGSLLTMQAKGAQNYRLYTMNGKLSQQGKVKNNGQLELSTVHLPAGIYMLVTDNGLSSQIIVH